MNSLLPPSPPSGLQLTAILRPLESEGNLFVRLTPRTASQLASLLNSSPSISPSRDVQDDMEVNFLPLEITINQQCKEHDDDAGRDGIVIYASYNGGAPTNLVHPSQPHYPSTNHDNIIDLPPNLHSSLVSIFNSTSEPVVVSVRPLEDIPVGEIVTFEPLTTSDWEMIEMEASVLEDGGLLNQITIVSTGQVFPLKFGGRLNNLDSAAWIKVVNIDHASCANDVSDEDSETSFASDSDYYSSVGSSVEGNNNIRSESNRCSRSGRCVRLMAETEVVVIPKPRIRREDPVQGDEKKSNGQLSNEEEEARVYCPSNALRVQPVGSHILHAISGIEGMPSLPNPRLGSVCIHPSTAMQLPGYSDINQIQRTLQYPDQEMLPFVVTIRKVDGPHAKYLPSYEADDGGETHSNVLVARIFTTNDAHPGHIGMHAFLCYQLGVSPLVDWVSVQIWSEYHVVNSINDTRDRIDGIDITKISTSATSENHSALYRNFPMNCSVTAPFSDLQSPCNPDMLFTSGTLVPSEFLQKLGCISLGQQHYVLRLQPIPNGIDSKDTSQLVPIITTRDLVKLLRVKTELEPISMEIKDVSAVLPLNGATFGFSSAIQDVVKSVTELMHTSDRGTSFVSKSMNKQAIMIVGEEGSGKSHLAMAASSKISLSKLCATVYLDCKKLQASSTNIQFILREIHIAFQEALHKQPSILVLDDLDSLIPNVGSSDTEVDGSTHQQQINPALISQVKIIVDHLLFQSQHCQEATRCGSPRVTLICTCRDINSLSGLYQESGIFHALIEVPSLDPSQRSQFLHSQLFRNMDVPPDNRVSRVFSRLGKATDGYRPKDLKVVATRILHLDCLRSFNGLKESGEELKTLELDIASVIEEYSPLCQKLVDIDPNLSSMDWEEIGGLYEVKQSLHDIILHPMKFKAVYENAPMDLPTGVLLYGPPGCGKSFIVPILAKAAKLNLITCKGPELLDRYIGASEAKVRQLFARASAAAPAMIFFDEFDSLAPQRGSDNTGVTDRVVNQLLTLLDGAERNKKAGHIFVVAATSRPDKVDKALLRPGRLEKHIYVGYPESISEWNSLLASLFKLRQTDEEVSRLEQSGDLFNSFCKDFSYARDFSAADVKAALDTAHLLSVHDIIDEDDGHEGPVVLEKRHILKAFEQTKPSLLPKDRQMLKSIYNSFGGKKTKDDSEYRSKVRQLKTSLR